MCDHHSCSTDKIISLSGGTLITNSIAVVYSYIWKSAAGLASHSNKGNFVLCIIGHVDWSSNRKTQDNTVEAAQFCQFGFQVFFVNTQKSILVDFEVCRLDAFHFTSPLPSLKKLPNLNARHGDKQHIGFLENRNKCVLPPPSLSPLLILFGRSCNLRRRS